MKPRRKIPATNAHNMHRPPYLNEPDEMPPQLTDLPDETLLNIMRATPTKSILQLASTCHRLHDLQSDPALWRVLVERDFGRDAIESALCEHASKHFNIAWCNIYAMLGRRTTHPGWGHRFEADATVCMGHFNADGKLHGFGAVFLLDPERPVAEVHALFSDGNLAPRGIAFVQRRGGPVRIGHVGKDLGMGYDIPFKVGVTWPVKDLHFQSYEDGRSGRPDRPSGFGELTLATGERISAYMTRGRCEGLAIFDHPATGFTRFLFPVTGSIADRFEVLIDRRGRVYTIGANGAWKRPRYRQDLCAAISKRLISPDDAELSYSIYGALGGSTRARERDLYKRALPWPTHLLMRPVGSITRYGHGEMVFHFVFDLISACASLKAAGITDLRHRVLPTALALHDEDRYARYLRDRDHNAPGPYLEPESHVHHPVSLDSIAWRLAMSRHPDPLTAGVVASIGTFGRVGSGIVTLEDIHYEAGDPPSGVAVRPRRIEMTYFDDGDEDMPGDIPKV